MASYASSSDMVTRIREQTLMDLVTDTGDRPESAALLTDAKLLAALADASAVIDAALVVGRRYTPDQLEALTGSSQNLLKRMTCEIALAFLLERNPGYSNDLYERYESIRERYLTRLQQGVDMFNLDAELNASLPTIDGPSSVTYERMNCLSTRLGGNLVPRVETRLPTDRG